MRRIDKGSEPRAWVEFRARPDARFDDVDAPKDEVRHALCTEQFGLCCYCMQRIGPTGQKMKIEHWAPQSKVPERALDYSNLLGACLGGQGGPPSMQHCDTAKGARAVHHDPTKADCSKLFRYLSTGEIRETDGNARAKADIETLALNHPRLREGRKARIDETLRQVQSLGTAVSVTRLEAIAASLAQPDATGNLPPFCEAAVFWLRRQAAKRR